jgi:uncharacterized protein YheU (UPF0270 family)
MEIIKDLDKMIVDLLQLFARSCGNRLPNKIVFYRDGVDDGQYQKVLDNEVAKIKQAFRSNNRIILPKKLKLTNPLFSSDLCQSTTTKIDIYCCEKTT